MPSATIQMMIDSCQGLDDLWGVQMPRNYVSVNMRSRKATGMMDQPKPKAQADQPQRADQPLQVVHFDFIGQCKQPLFAGHSCCVVLIDNLLSTVGSTQSKGNLNFLMY